MRPASRNPLRGPASWRGSVAAELALIAPLLFIAVLCTTDVIRVFRAQLRMEMIAVQIGQIVSQCSRISDPGDLSEFWDYAVRIADGRVDVNSPSGGAIVVSALSQASNANQLNWQRRAGNASSASAFTAATAPIIRGRANQAFLVPDGQTLFATEVFAIIEPWTISAGLIGTALPSEIYGISMFLSRAGEPARLRAAPTTSNARDCTA